MKKIIIALLILVSVSSSVFAAVSVGSWSTQTNGNVVGSDSAASLKAAFTINKDSIADQVTIGFTSSDLSSGIDVADNIENILSEGVVLSDNDGDGRASNEGKTVNVFWQVTSANKLDVSLYLNGPMSATINSGESGGDETEYLGWAIYAAPVSNIASDSSLISFSAPNEGSPTLEKKSYDLGIGHDPTVKPSVAGYKSITIATDDYRNKPTGTYEGYVYVEVAAEEGGTI